MRIIYFLLFFIAIGNYACNNKDAGVNRSNSNKEKLETIVYHHYKYDDKDSLKLAAAKFLIENMNGHFSINSKNYLQDIESIKLLKGVSYFNKKAMELTFSYFMDTDNKVMDVDVVSSDFLIKHIDSVFERRKLYPWLKDVSNEVFFEYILPYRFLHEPLDCWVDSLSISEHSLADVSLYDNLKYSPSLVYRHIYNKEKYDNANDHTLKQIFGNVPAISCYFSAATNLLKYRSLGIPSAIDFTPAYANRNGFHYWVSVISPEEYGKLEVEPGRRISKVYRYMYSKTNRYADYTDESIPVIFRNPFIKDVTDCYLRTRNVTVPILDGLQRRISDLCYLSVFNTGQWQPVAIAEKGVEKVTFDRMPVANVYLPVYWGNDKWKAFNYPFIVFDNAKTTYLIPDTINKQKICVYRKYPYNEKLNAYCKLLEGIEVWGANNPLFDDAQRLCELRRSERGQVYENQLSIPDKFRYLKLVSVKARFGLSEIVLFDEKGERITHLKTDSCFQEGIDQNPLTCVFNTGILGKEMLIDLGTPVAVKKIICYPRSDGNHIYPGNKYELLYFDLGGWKSLGVKSADSYYVEYDSVPTHALYWLKCLNGGIEERIFTYENGSQRFF